MIEIHIWYHIVKSLRQITIKEALPIILFHETQFKVLAPPERLKQAKLQDGRLLYETEFETGLIASPVQYFFCPHPTCMGHNCLFIKQFDQSESQILECEREPIPVIERVPRESPHCGPATGDGIKLRFVYKICPEQADIKFENDSNNFATYSFCYDGTSKKILFMDHEIISAELLSEKILIREREVKFEKYSAETYDLIDSDYRADLDSAADKLKPNYTLQKLIPAEDMAFATWIRTTYHYVNVALQYNILSNLWNEINMKITAEVLSKYASSPPRMITAVLDTPTNELPTSEQDKQLSNVWVKLILNLNKKSKTGLAILMNNFITDETSDLTRHFIDSSKICPENLCVDTLRKKFTDIGGKVRCCPVTEDLMSFFFNEQELKGLRIEKVMPILDVTFRRPPV
ncbi:uncharacterized protein LOC135835305 isoform X2 [Planococcus citri]|uniref:uncharacterized protein LOC135835305 isoform X2 n=1 Tax=Planococcus citri TaxID=170843 RepID=UPI0031F7BD3D